MRILLFMGSLHTGGSQMQFCALARGLRDAGQDVTVATLFPGGRFWDRLAGEPGLPLVPLRPARPGGRAGLAADLALAPGRLRRLLVERSPDVVYSMLDAPNLIALLARPRGGPPLVLGLRSGVNRQPWHGTAARRLGVRLSGRAALAIANSRRGLRHYEGLGLRTPRRVVVGNGVDTGVFRIDPAAGRATRRRWGLSDDGPVVGLVGRLAPVKDHGTFLAAARRVADARPDVRFVIVGGGKPRAAAALRREAAAGGLAGRAHLVGEQDDMPAVYNALDALALTSVGEGFPNVLLEGMSCGLPCVSTDVGAAPEILSDDGVIVPVGDAAALAAGLLGLLSTPPGGRERRRRRIVARHSLEAMTTATLRHLGGAVADGREERAS